VICHYLFRSTVRSQDRWQTFASGFLAGAWAILLGALLSSAALTLAGKSFVLLAGVFLTAHIPVALIEGLVTGSVVVLLRQVRPEVLCAPLLLPLAEEIGDG
jgi:cobalt/nickel transport system permease protein